MPSIDAGTLAEIKLRVEMNQYEQILADEFDMAATRGNSEPPHEWGYSNDPEATFYFCTACWKRGGSGGHPYDSPPCDPIRPPWA